MEISEGWIIAGDWPTASTRGIAEHIWFQTLTLIPGEGGGKKGNFGLSVSLLVVEKR